jgi:hypothetical protein
MAVWLEGGGGAGFRATAESEKVLEGAGVELWPRAWRRRARKSSPDSAATSLRQPSQRSRWFITTSDEASSSLPRPNAFRTSADG